MTRQFHEAKYYWVRRALYMALGVLNAVPIGVEAQPIRGLFHNEDETDFFWHGPLSEEKAGETIDRYIEVMADAGVKVFVCNTNARRTIYRSRVWDACWDGYDSAGPDDQPFLAPIPRQEVAGFRRGIANMLAVYRAGIDYPARVVERCRHHKMSPWISLRMNDCHCNDIPDHPFHGSFWKKNPQFRRQNVSGYFATNLDYAHPEVRDFYKALVIETLERYDIDGLELDFMREPYLFSAGKEAEGAKTLTQWLRQIRKLTADAAAVRGHPIRVGVRVPSQPEVALGWGLDAITWAKQGLIDVLAVTPRWATLEFDMPIQQWREMLVDSKVTLVGGLEVRYQPYPGGPATIVTPELATGAAASVLSQGADAVYLFNYFQNSIGWPRPVYLSTLKAMDSLDLLQRRPRSIGITYRDVIGPQENYRAPLPVTGKELVFLVKLGPGVEKDSLCDVLIGFALSQDAPMAIPTVLVNGQACTVRDNTTKEGLRLISFGVPKAALAGAEVCEIKISSTDRKDLDARRVEMCLRKANE